MKMTLAILGTTVGIAAGANPLTIQSHTAGQAGFDVSSYLISGQKEAVLVDTQFTRSEAKKVAELVKQSGKNLTTIVITHAHPDHYLGLEILTQSFLKARVIARKSVVEEIRATAQGKIDYWKKMYGDDLADTFILPTVDASASLCLEGEKLELVDLVAGESETATAVYLSSQKALIAGDAVYRNVHLWLAENRPEGFLKNIALIENLGPIEKIFSGHGGEAEISVLSANRQYVEAFLEVTATAANPEAAIEEMKRRFPEYDLPIIAELSIRARMKK